MDKIKCGIFLLTLMIQKKSLIIGNSKVKLLIFFRTWNSEKPEDLGQIVIATLET